MVAPERHEFGQRHHHRIDEAGEAFHVEHDDLLQGRAARAAGQDLVELLLVLGEDHLGRGIVDEIFDLDRRIGRIDAGRNAAGAEDAHVGIDPFRHRVGDDRGDVAGPEADGVQAVGDVLGDLQPLPPAGRLPDAELLFADRGPVAARLHGRAENSSRSCRRPSALPVWPCSLPPSLACPGRRLTGLFSKQAPNLAPTRSERHALNCHPYGQCLRLRCSLSARSLAPRLLLLPAPLAPRALFLGAEIEFLDVL